MFKKFVLLTLSVILVAAMAISPASAESEEPPMDATVYVVHGIPGLDVSPDLDPKLPVDVSVNGACALKGFKFGEIVGPLALPAGVYEIKIGLADKLAPCSADAVISAKVELMGGQAYVIAAYLAEGGAPTAGLFPIDLSKQMFPRVYAFHLANAPKVDITLHRQSKKNPLHFELLNVSNGQYAMVDPAPLSGYYLGSIFAAGTIPSGEPVFGPAKLTFRTYKTYLLFAVGSLEKGTFTVLQKVIKFNMKPTKMMK